MSSLVATYSKPSALMTSTMKSEPGFVTVSGAHLYGFPSPDSDFDLRGVHVLPVRDVVGLYLNPPERAVVLCVDEKSQIQALDRTAPTLHRASASARCAPFGPRPR